MTVESPSLISPNACTGFNPERTQTTTITANELTLVFQKQRGDLTLEITEDERLICLPLWALREIRDYLAVEFPQMAPSEAYSYGRR